MTMFSLAHTVDLEAQRLGLQAWEVVNLIESHIQSRYLRMGRIVHVSVDLESKDQPLNAIEAKESLTGTVWEPVGDVRRPNADVLQREIEQYVRQKEQTKRWWLAACQVVSIADDHYLVQLSSPDEPGLDGATGVLPINRAGARTGQLEKGDTVWGVIKEKDKSRFDGAESWQTVDCDYLVSRTDSIFLRMLVKKYWHMEVRADIYSGSGMVIVPDGHDVGPIIGPKGQHLAKLKQITGPSRITVIRSVSSKRPDLRLASAVRQITGLEGVKVRPPKKDSQEWRLIVRQKDANVLIGSHGINLYFIKSASGLSITHLIRDSQ